MYLRIPSTAANAISLKVKTFSFTGPLRTTLRTSCIGITNTIEYEQDNITWHKLEKYFRPRDYISMTGRIK